MPNRRHCWRCKHGPYRVAMYHHSPLRLHLHVERGCHERPDAAVASCQARFSISARTKFTVQAAEAPPFTDRPIVVDATVESNPADVAISGSETPTPRPVI